jgi:hypothetical protein
VCLCGPAFASDVRVLACFHMCVCMWLGWVGLEYLFIYFFTLFYLFALIVYLLMICVLTDTHSLTPTHTGHPIRVLSLCSMFFYFFAVSRNMTYRNV